jgi:phage tail sheath protein FI
VFAGCLVLAIAGPGAAQIVQIETAVAGFVGQSEQGPLDQPTLVTSYDAFLSVFGGGTAGLTNPFLAPSVQAFFDNGGSRLFIVRTAGADDASLIGSPAIGGTPAAGLRALAGIDEIGIVAIPGATSQAVHGAMIAECEALRDRICLLDPGSRDDVGAVLVERAGLWAPEGFAALYFPWVLAAPSGPSVELPPSGFVAGVYARNDSTRGVWRSPAGTEAVLFGATGLSHDVSTAEQELLNPEGVNALRDLPSSPPLVFGARTLSSDPEWRFLAVRRLASFIAESVEEGTAYARFQANESGLWAQLEADVEDFLESLFVQGALQGSSPEEAYFVRCDATTVTALDLAEGRTVIEIGIAPTRPAEFVVLRVVQQRAPAPAVPMLPAWGIGGLLAGALLIGKRALRPRSIPTPRWRCIQAIR